MPEPASASLATAAPAAAPAFASPAAAPAAPTAPASGAPAGDDPFAELDTRARGPAKTAAPPEGDKPAEKPGDKADLEADKPPTDKTGREITPGVKSLREQLGKTTSELKQLREAHAAMEAKIADYEKRGKDTTMLTERLAALEKERDELQGKVRSLDFTASDEYKAKYETPFNDAADETRLFVSGLTINDNGTDRPADWVKDFAPLYHLYQTSPGAAIAKAREMFGEDVFGVILGHLSTLNRLSRAASKAMEAEKGNWTKSQNEKLANESKRREAMQASFAKVNTDLATRYPDWFGVDPKDEEGNKLLTDGFKLVDAAFHNRQALTPEQLIVLDAQIRNRAAAFSREVYRNQKLTSRVAELEEALARAKGSKPGDTQNKGGKDAPTHAADWRDDLRKELA